MEKNRKKVVLLASGVSFGNKPQAALKAASPQVAGDRSKTPAMPKPLSTEMTRETWRPSVGPAKDIPLKLSAATTTKKKAQDFEELEKIRQQVLRNEWRPQVGPAAA